ncbi:GTPase Era [Porphyromonas uenonis]|uniref:GTPase Era n=1 Tax=Porphyromonas uenonis TaxID=281920 RepID=UPI00288BC785|nr:GTPase Era [Porphyromonas uenonis]
MTELRHLASNPLPEGYKSGFVSIVGNPNVGKSTLMNYLVGERISIITSKAQTTRHRILGIVNSDRMQVVYSDTPGVLQPSYKLQERMRAYSEQALEDADLLLYVTDTIEERDKHHDFVERVQRLSCPIIIVINKVDLTEQKHLEELVDYWHSVIPQAEIIPVSALRQFNLAPLKKRIEELLPVSPPYFEQDALTDRPARFFVSEIIREKALQYYHQEVPYAVEVVVEEFVESPDRIDMRCVILVERESQKGIIIGHKGSAIKRLGISARKDLERFFDKHIHLTLLVRVDKDWRQSDQALTQFGYDI